MFILLRVVVTDWISRVEVAGLLKGFLQVHSLYRDRYFVSEIKGSIERFAKLLQSMHS